MLKLLLKLFLVLLITISSLVIHLTYFGIETDRFNQAIKSKASTVNEHVKLDFKKIKIHFNPSDLNLIVRLNSPQILIKNNTIVLSRLDLFLGIKSLFDTSLLLKKIEVEFAKNNIRDLTKITNIFVPRIINRQIEKIFKEGVIEGEFTIPFDLNGNVASEYGFSGRLLDASINLTKEVEIKNLSMEINFEKNKKGNITNIDIQKGKIFDLDLADSKIKLKLDNKSTQIDSLLRTNGNFDLYQIKKISSLLKLNLDGIEDIKGNVNLNTNINFKLNRNYKIENLLYSIDGKISYLEAIIKKNKIIKKYLSDYKDKLVLKNSDIKHKGNKLLSTTELNGFIKQNDSFNIINIKQIYNHNKNSFDINGVVDLTNSKILIPKLNYIKDYNKKSEINFDINFILNKYFYIKKIQFTSDNDLIHLIDIKFNKKFEIRDLKKIEIKTYKEEIKNNDFIVEKLDKIKITGKIFDSQPLLKSLYKKDEKQIFSKKFTSEILISFDKVITGTNDDVSDFGMIAKINKGSYDKLSLKGNFSKNEILEMSIYKIDNGKKTVHVISDRARPFVKNFEFVEGFEGGRLEYQSLIQQNVSNSTLLITDFKVSKVPALAKLLTLASLQGIGDTLSGEGIRFESFEMKSNSTKNVMNIEDALAIGPAVSILLDGYVEKGKVVSLRVTLVPATKLNSIIASIPVVGDILVGKKSGDGIIGVSFKMKGPPKNIKTTVNPIKTLTPRFIVRAIENIKKNKELEAK